MRESREYPDSRLPTPGFRAAFITVGDTARLTGGYLYHARVFERLGEYGIAVEEIVPTGASVDEQKSGATKLGVLDPREYDVVVVDALARVVCAPFIEGWREHRPVVAMVHELPSLASPEADVEIERSFENALLGVDSCIAVSVHGKSILEGRGFPAKRIHVVSPGFDGFTSKPGSRETGSRETGSRETGSRETGSRETGSRETGSRETGSRETGSRETGSRETGSRETGSREGDPRFDSVGRGGSFRGADPVWDTRRKVRRGASRAETLSPAGGTFHRSVSTNEDAGRREGFPVEDGVAGVRNPANFGFLRAICVAQWIPRKGILDLVEAWRSLEASNASLRLIGDTDADPEYRSRVMEAIGEDASITVFGTLDDESLAAAYAESDFFVLPSRYEGYGIVYAEALSFGLPVVACDVGSVPEVVGREAGLFVGPGDAEGLAHAIYTLLSDGNLRCRMSDAAFRRVEILPRWDDTARGFAEVLREAVGRG